MTKSAANSVLPRISLSFALLRTPLVGRIAVIVLMLTFVGAVSEFGRFDPILHRFIFVLLPAIVADDQPSHRLKPIMATVRYSVAMGTTILAYYVAHALLYASAVVQRTLTTSKGRRFSAACTAGVLFCLQSRAMAATHCRSSTLISAVSCG